ncbi:MAG: UDP-3-O-(3-hydroxymyristoyl)glucosamine N-acyltransferase [Nitrospinae bacterium]|nr:UDP-3-O-(3-hydroxymyristoyl)glucosamine N-acyltransferase [Nitrospinota bacterium]
MEIYKLNLMKMKLRKIAELVCGELDGDKDIEILGVKQIEEATEGYITFLSNKRYLKKLRLSRASAVIVSDDIDVEIPKIRVKNPYLAFAKILKAFYPEIEVKRGVDKRAVIGNGVKIGEEVAIYPFVYVGDDVEIGDGSVLYPFVSIGNGSKIGNNTIIYSNVSIYHRVFIGKNVIIHSGAVIGSDGFGFVKMDNGTHQKIPQVGFVIIEDDVEIGANVCVDRATMDKTIIKRGTKLDNFIQIAHNVVIGEDSVIAAQTGISGSCRLGKGVTIGGQVGIIDHINIGDNVILIPQAGVMKDIESNRVFAGIPAMDHTLWKKTCSAIPKLPELIRKVRKIEKGLIQMSEDKKSD